MRFLLPRVVRARRKRRACPPRARWASSARLPSRFRLADPIRAPPLPLSLRRSVSRRAAPASSGTPAPRTAASLQSCRAPWASDEPRGAGTGTAESREYDENIKENGREDLALWQVTQDSGAQADGASQARWGRPRCRAGSPRRGCGALVAGAHVAGPREEMVRDRDARVSAPSFALSSLQPRGRCVQRRRNALEVPQAHPPPSPLLVTGPARNGAPT